MKIETWLHSIILLLISMLASLAFVEENVAQDVYSLGELRPNVMQSVRKVLLAVGKQEERQELKTFLKEYDTLYKYVIRVVKCAGEDLIHRRPELKERVGREIKSFPIREFNKSPMFLFDSTTEEDVLRSWREQLQANLTQIRVLLRNNPKEIIRHQWVWYEDYRKDRREFFCAVQIRNCLREACKLTQLMTSNPKVVRIAKDKMLFEETFSGEHLSRWKKYGEANTEIKDGSLYVKGHPFMIWTAMGAFEGSCVVSLDFTPGEGRGGTILAFPGSPRIGLDYSVSAGRTAPRFHLPPGNKDIMEPYNWGINTYHVSVHRHRAHLRRAGAGLKMLNVLFKDPCAEKYKTYRIKLLQHSKSFQVMVDRKLIHYYVDAGVYGPVLTKGQFGIKQFGDIGALYDNIQIHSLKSTML